MKLTLNRGDIFGGVTAGIVALPLALAFGVQSGMGAAAGLYGAIALGIFASLFGGTNTQVSGPTGPMTVVSATVVASLIALKGDFQSALPTILLTFMLAGVFQIAMGFTGIGKYIKYIPYPVISGFMTGIGVIIILLQIFPMLGHTSPNRTIDVIFNLGDALRNINWQAVLLGATTIVIIYLFPKITKVVPSALVALLVVTLIAVFGNMDVATIGEIPKGLPKLHLEIFGSLGDIQYILMAALTLSALGAIDSLLTSVVADNVTKTQHNSNKELIGQGIGNTVAGLIGGIPGAGATMRTLVNIRAGGTTKFSGAIHGVLLLLILVALSPFASKIPLSVLSGILITVGIGIIDRKGLRHMKVSKTDTFIMLVVLGLTVFVDLLQAVGAGMVIASLMFMKQMGDITQTQSKNTITPARTDESESLQNKYNIPADLRRFVHIKKINGPLFFGNSTYFQDLSQQVSKETKAMILDLRRVPYIDQSGLFALESIILTMEQQNVQVYLLGIQDQPKSRLEAIKAIPDLVETECIFEDAAPLVQKLKEDLRSSN